MRLPRLERPKRVRVIRLIGGLTAFGVVVGGAAVAARWPTFAPFSSSIATAITWWIGKALGIPLDAITQAALTHMQPAKVVELVLSTVHSLPPEDAAAITTGLKDSLRPPPPPPVQFVGLDDAVDVPIAPDGTPIPSSRPPPPRDSETG